MKTAIINARIEPSLKEKSTAILKDLGIDTTTAINMFLRQVVINNGIPFEISKEPTNKTKRAIKESSKLKGKARFENIDDMFESLNS